MRQLKSSGEDLRRLFADEISVLHIAEPLAAADATESISTVLTTMNERGFDVYGVMEADRISGFITNNASLAGCCGDACMPFHVEDLISEQTPLLDVYWLLQHRERLFVLEANCVRYIVTRGDLQKAPVRMLLFGLVTLLEMQLLRLVRLYHPDDSWRILLRDERLAKASELFEDRRERNSFIDLADCLQLCDKRDILLGTSQWLVDMNNSKTGLSKSLKAIEKLRNSVAHGQDLAAEKAWDETFDVTREATELLSACERIGSAA